jgi:hypothetical protein
MATKVLEEAYVKDESVNNELLNWQRNNGEGECNGLQAKRVRAN